MEHSQLDEYLEALWYMQEAELSCVGDGAYPAGVDFTAEVRQQLRQQGIIEAADDDRLVLTTRGRQQARQIVRCHRLAERLLTDVLGMPVKETERGACAFEHVVVPEIADSICTLLGHPRECPHGLAIPEGSCCRGARQTVTSAIVPLDRVRVGERVKISYINTPSNSRMHKLAHFGIIPGAAVTVHQRYPSFVIACGNTQLAMEEDVAREIFVLYPDAGPPEPRRAGRRRLGRRRSVS